MGFIEPVYLLLKSWYSVNAVIASPSGLKGTIPFFTCAGFKENVTGMMSESVVRHRAVAECRNGSNRRPAW